MQDSVYISVLLALYDRYNILSVNGKDNRNIFLWITARKFYLSDYFLIFFTNTASEQLHQDFLLQQLNEEQYNWISELHSQEITLFLNCCSSKMCQWPSSESKCKFRHTGRHVNILKEPLLSLIWNVLNINKTVFEGCWLCDYQYGNPSPTLLFKICILSHT